VRENRESLSFAVFLLEHVRPSRGGGPGTDATRSWMRVCSVRLQPRSTASNL
jgi:hypothetical protein